MKRQFASDNYAGICPEAWEALCSVNEGHAQPYGEDEWTLRACDTLRDFFGTPCEVFFVHNGTAANALGLAALCQSHHGVLCHEVAHIETDECGAPEFFSGGSKLIPLPGAMGKLEPEIIDRMVGRRKDTHFPRIKALSISQPTEVGTVYSLVELAALREAGRRAKLRIHMDGARFFGAVESLGCSPREIIDAGGVTILSLGATKLGISGGDAVVVFDREVAEDFAYRCKQAGQLTSKMRFVSAQWAGLFHEHAWKKHVAHARKMALLLRDELSPLDLPTFPYPTQVNSVFVTAPTGILESLRMKGWMFYEFIGGAARLMTSWDTTADDVHALASDFRNAVINSPFLK